VVFDSWLRILARTPKSILWLLRFPAVAEKNILRCAELWAGPEMASRIRFTDVAPKELHIQRCRVADLFLDTIECNAHTVATEFVCCSFTRCRGSKRELFAVFYGEELR
jgi:protein O-GlcNAc transferase